jgi:hypothetical protein
VPVQDHAMSQIALPLDDRLEENAGSFPSVLALSRETRPGGARAWGAPEELTGFEAEGFRIGWEHARHLTTPPADHLHAGHPVRQGWEAGRAAFAGRTLAASRAARLWLDLRLQAWLRGRPFDELLLTPRYVARIDLNRCPIMRVTLSHSPAGARSATDAVVMPLNERAACAAGNLAVVSRQVAQARGVLSLEEVAQTVRRLASGEAEAVDGLDLSAWRRLHSLISLATPQAHAQAASQALHLLPPPRVRLLNPAQALQTLLTLVFTGPGYARQLTDLGALMPHAQARRAYFVFMNAMLARRLSARGGVPTEQVRTAMEQAWSHPLVQQRWQALALVLTPAQAEQVVRRVVQRGLLGTSSPQGGRWRWLDEAAATEGWSLEGQGGLNRTADVPVKGPARSQPARRQAGAVAPHGAAGRPTAPRQSPSLRPAAGPALSPGSVQGQGAPDSA